jgi:hypothetical protein
MLTIQLKEWSYTSTTPYAFTAQYLMKHQRQLQYGFIHRFYNCTFNFNQFSLLGTGCDLSWISWLQHMVVGYVKSRLIQTVAVSNYMHPDTTTELPRQRNAEV